MDPGTGRITLVSYVFRKGTQEHVDIYCYLIEGPYLMFYVVAPLHER